MAIAVAMLQQLPRGLTSGGRHNAAPSWKAERYRAAISSAGGISVKRRTRRLDRFRREFATHLGLRRRSAFYTLSRPPRAGIYATYCSKFYASAAPAHHEFLVEAGEGVVPRQSVRIMEGLFRDSYLTPALFP
jgi:hypothetical protein